MELDSLDPYVFFDTFNHYGEVIASFEKEDRFIKIPELNGFLTFLCKELSNGKRKEELYLLKILLEKGKISRSEFKQILTMKQLGSSEQLFKSIENCLDYNFFVKRDQEKYGLSALSIEDDTYQLATDFTQFLTEEYKKFILDIIQTGLERSQKYPQEPLTIGEKYSKRCCETS